MSELISVKLKSEAIKADRFLLLLLIIHFPFAAFIVPYGYGTMWIGIISGGVTVLLALLGYAFLRGTVLLQILNAILLMTYSAIFVTCQLGRIEMHFHFFSAMAFLVTYRDWRWIPGMVAYVALHHGIVNYCQTQGVQIAGIPLMVFNYRAGWDIVFLHALFVVFEASILWWICVHLRRQFFAQEVMIQELNDLREKNAGQIIQEVNTTSESMHSVSRELSTAAENMAENSQNQAASLEETSAAMEEITAAMENISETTSRQYLEVEQMIEQMNQLREITGRVSNQVDNATTTVSRTAGNAIMGEKSLNAMSASMGKIAESSDQMRGIVALINDISDKVNLLSLNASIEAARAGDAGRGFTVVAEEISRLADRTAESIQNINQLIEMSSGLVRDGLITMRDSNSVLKSIIQDVESINSVIKEIHDSMERQTESYSRFTGQLDAVRTVANNVKTSTEEQKSSVREIMDSLSRINGVTQENATTADRVSAIAEQNQGLAQDLMQKIAGLSR
ncbi:MAG: hypothetical protein KDK30_13230 [Leptospiraceae bacterium]|nr:hypothetical protein [Leptospiraceae bacterium]